MVVTLVVEPGSTAYRLSSCCLAAYGIFLDQGSNLCPVHCIGRQLLHPWNTKEGCVFLFFFFIGLFFWLCHTACGILVPQPEITPVPLAVRTQSPNPQTTREFPFSQVPHHGGSRKCCSQLTLALSRTHVSLGLYACCCKVSDTRWVCHCCH